MWLRSWSNGQRPVRRSSIGRTSIVDLLKLLDMDSSLAARKELAKELYCPDELMNDSARMNMWLHKNVLANIAANGGNVPADLLD